MAVSVTSIFLFLSTPSARRATDGLRSNLQTQLISIHALREEGDSALRGRGNGRKNFYPRPPRGGRPGRSAAQPIVPRFLSTPSARRATRFAYCIDTEKVNFYPRPPRGGRPRIEDDQNVKDMISIHALREEGDPRTPAAWCVPLTISIHALREEGDFVCRPFFLQ